MLVESANDETIRLRSQSKLHTDLTNSEHESPVENNATYDDNKREQPEKNIGQEERRESKNNVQKKTKKLLCINEMPDHLQFNPYILSGYRPLQKPMGCVGSIFQWHNETVNIFTHAIPIFYIILTVPDVLPWHSKELTFLAWCHIAGILCPWMGSFIYHMFMNLDYGPLAYYILLQIDMLGIWISQSIGALPLVFASTKCLPDIFRWSVIIFYCLLSIWGLYKAMIAWSPWERRLCFLLPFLTRICLWGLRLTKIGGGDPAAFLHVVLQANSVDCISWWQGVGTKTILKDLAMAILGLPASSAVIGDKNQAEVTEDAVSIAGGCIGAIHVPEKWFPGYVDLILNSHNIMHVLVVAAVWSMHQATTMDLHWMAKNQCYY